MEVPAVKYVAAGVAPASLALTGLSALSAAGTPGAAAPSPTFGEVFGWFQSMALSGMMSVQYPKVYQSFSNNFGFSTGLVQWDSMQSTIDSFRASTGGNLTNNNYQYLKNATLVFKGGANSSTAGTLGRRAVNGALLFLRDGTVSVDGEETTIGDATGTSGDAADASDQAQTKNQKYVAGIQAYVEQLKIPSPNTFMTLLLCFCIVVAAIIVVILLFKVILEAWSMAKPLSPAMESWRKRYWWRLAKAITNYFAGTWSDRFGRKPVLVAGWLVAVPVPILLWHGDEDYIVPVAHGEHLADHVPGAELRIKPGAAHLANLSLGDEVLEAIVRRWPTDDT